MQELSGKKKLAAELRAQGIKSEAIAAEVGVHPATVRKWFSKNGGEAIRAAARVASDAILAAADDRRENLLDAIKQDVEAAWARLRQLSMSASRESTRLEATLAMLDRGGIAPLARTESHNVTELQGLSRDDRQELYSEVLSIVRPSGT